MDVLVLGGRGFIGRHVVLALRTRGHRVIIGTRDNPHGDGDFRQVRIHRVTGASDWSALLSGTDVVVNTVGILRERIGEGYDAVHHRAPAALATACAAHSKRLIHVSALGLSSNARSGFLRSKFAGEQAIAASRADYTIVRPSLVEGEGGFGAKWVRWVARWPIHITPRQAVGKMAPIDAHDLGEAIALLCERRGTDVPREVELGGCAHRNMRDYLAAMRPAYMRPALTITLPLWMARLASHVCDVLHFSPYSFGHLELMRRDNLPRDNLLPELLGRAPRPVGVNRINIKGLATPGDLSLEAG